MLYDRLRTRGTGILFASIHDVLLANRFSHIAPHQIASLASVARSSRGEGDLFYSTSLHIVCC